MSENQHSGLCSKCGKGWPKGLSGAVSSMTHPGRMDHFPNCPGEDQHSELVAKIEAGLRIATPGKSNVRLDAYAALSDLEEQYGTLVEAARMLDACEEGISGGPCVSCRTRLHEAIPSNPASKPESS